MFGNDGRGRPNIAVVPFADLLRPRRARFVPAHPPFREAVYFDVVNTLAHRSEPSEITSRWHLVREMIRLSWQSDAFFAVLVYRIRAELQRRGVPLLPRLAHRISMITAQVCIGDPVAVAPGLYLMHGQVVIDGCTTVGRNAVIAPWITIGLVAGNLTGPTIGDGAHIGTGARILGPVVVGDDVRIGANAVVIDDVPDRATAVGVPARIRTWEGT